MSNRSVWPTLKSTETVHFMEILTCQTEICSWHENVSTKREKFISLFYLPPSTLNLRVQEWFTGKPHHKLSIRFLEYFIPISYFQAPSSKSLELTFYLSARLSCFLKFFIIHHRVATAGDYHWAGIYKPLVEDSFDRVFFCFVQGILKVFASLVDGHLCIFTKDLDSSSNSRPIFDETEEDIVQFEKDKWDVQVGPIFRPLQSPLK